MDTMVGDRIRIAREAAGLSQAELGARLGVAPQTIYKYEKGIVDNMPMNRIAAIARVCGVEPMWLCCWDEHMAKQEIMSAVDSLSADQQKQILQYIRFLKSEQE